MNSISITRPICIICGGYVVADGLCPDHYKEKHMKYKVQINFKSMKDFVTSLSCAMIFSTRTEAESYIVKHSTKHPDSAFYQIVEVM